MPWVCPNTEYSFSSTTTVALASLGELANSRNMLISVIRRLGAWRGGEGRGGEGRGGEEV